MFIIFRIDDIYLNNNTFEHKIFKLFEKHNVPLSLGIIPFDNENKPFINSQISIPKNLTPCLHGYNHTRRGLIGEFDGLPKNEQYILIKRGKEHLESIIGKTINCFIPPWNRYDNNTLLAIQENGVINLSGGQIKNYNLDNEIPCSVEHFNLLDKFWFRILILLLPKKTKLVVLFHNFNFEEHTSTHFSNNKFVYNLVRLEKLLINLKKGRHVFANLNQGRVQYQRFIIVSDIIKKITGQRVRFWE